MSHYAEAFYVEPGQCFRFVHSGVGHAAHCREPVVQRGEFIDGTRLLTFHIRCEPNSQVLLRCRRQACPREVDRGLEYHLTIRRGSLI
jgi:hypothetical protein